MSGEAPPVQASGLVKRYGQIVAVDHVDLSVHAGDVYGFLATRKWITFGLLMMLLAAIMVRLGFWQLSRYHERAGANAHIDASTRAAAVPLGSVLRVGQPAPAGLAWARVRVTVCPSTKIRRLSES